MLSLEQEVEKLSLFENLKKKYIVDWNKDADPLLKDRYLIKNDVGEVIETKEELIYRVASALSNDATDIEKFYSMMAKGIFLPNTPTLVNAQRPLRMLSACLVLPTGDSIEEWAKTISDHMIMVKAGIGTGIDLSPIRQEGAMISSTKGEAAGALGLLNLINESAKVVKQGSIRPSANMGTMRITHPDLDKFINAKQPTKEVVDGQEVQVFDKLEQFNISITAFDDEMDALFNNGKIPIVEPHTGKTIGHRNGKELLESIVKNVWIGGDPGLLNISKANKNNPIIEIINPLTGKVFGLKVATNPCGEQWLYAYSVCNLGSINLTKFVKNGQFNFTEFSRYVIWSIEFLDKVIDANKFPISEIEFMTKYLRNIGLGIMGWADTLLMMGIPYDSEEAIGLAHKIMNCFKMYADFASSKLADEHGVAPVLRETDQHFRNYERSCIAPTGSISHIVGVSSGIEPNFSFAYTRNTSLKDGTKFFIVNPVLKNYLKRFDDGRADIILQMIVDNGGIINDVIAEEMELEENYFKSTFDVSPEWHIRHQAVFQKYVDNAVSKTINVPEEFTTENIKKAYELSWKLGCKGITIYRNNSRSYQILNNNNKKEEKIKEPLLFITMSDTCCDDPNFIYDDGCKKCTNCNWSACS